MAWGNSNKKSSPQQQHSTEEIANILEASTVVKGDLKSDRGFRIDGTIEGSVESKGAIVIGESGAVDGDVRGGDVIVVGRVDGNINARGHLDIRSSGKVVGDVKAASFRIETGGVFLGTSRMGEEPDEPAGVMNAATSMA
jgi:cytoskeletal protein CcmA (bactofilin family)